MKKTHKSLIILLLIPILVFGGIGAYKHIKLNIEKKLNPLPERYLSTVKKYSKEYNIPIELLCGVINTESSFEPDAVSHAGAMGMMQITEETFNWLQFKSGETYTVDKLYDYETNIKFGAFFLSLLYEEFQNWDTALAAYNAGRGRVNNWLDDSRYSKDGKLTDIPFEETANYIIKVNKSTKIYKKLYFSEVTTE